jgi:hypothetical protein
VKNAILIVILVLASIGGTVFWMKTHNGSAPPDADEAKPAAEAGTGITIKHDGSGNVVLQVSKETADTMGLKVANPVATSLKPEMIGYGRVQDPAPLASLATDLSVAEAAWIASSNELARLQTLSSQGNTSARALETAQTTATHDQLGVQSLKDRLVMSWCPALADQPDFPGLIRALISLDAALVRVNLAPGEALPVAPLGARVVTLFGAAEQAQFLGEASTVDPQTQRRGLIFLVKPDPAHIPAGEAVTCYLELPGEAAAGVIVPGDAVVRTDGAGWVYVVGSTNEIYTRTRIPLDHATDGGWFITNGLTAKDQVVTGGAQALLSEELKGQLKSD